jgi:hypothetical protein
MDGKMAVGMVGLTVEPSAD